MYEHYGLCILISGDISWKINIQRDKYLQIFSNLITTHLSDFLYTYLNEIKILIEWTRPQSVLSDLSHPSITSIRNLVICQLQINFLLNTFVEHNGNEIIRFNHRKGSWYNIHQTMRAAKINYSLFHLQRTQLSKQLRQFVKGESWSTQLLYAKVNSNYGASFGFLIWK